MTKMKRGMSSDVRAALVEGFVCPTDWDHQTLEILSFCMCTSHNQKHAAQLWVVALNVFRTSSTKTSYKTLVDNHYSPMDMV